jgi:hypothetical protein
MLEGVIRDCWQLHHTVVSFVTHLLSAGACRKVRYDLAERVLKTYSEVIQSTLRRDFAGVVAMYTSRVDLAGMGKVIKNASSYCDMRKRSACWVLVFGKCMSA